uniref:Uncharacterized protein n=1 Tax=Schistocephalus solidus TaxID=70667 RepID=A0A0X3QAL6_SCHSO
MARSFFPSSAVCQRGPGPAISAFTCEVRASPPTVKVTFQVLRPKMLLFEELDFAGELGFNQERGDRACSRNHNVESSIDIMVRVTSRTESCKGDVRKIRYLEYY